MDSYNSATPQQSHDVLLPVARSQPRNYMQIGAFHLDVGRRELYKDGSRVKVQSKVIEALVILLEHPGQIITRETLRARLWPNETQINYDANVNTTVNKLRHVLGDSHDHPSYVETIPRRGYTFIADAQFVEQPPFIPRQRIGSAAGLPVEKVFPAANRFFGTLEGPRWFTAGAISLFVGAVLFGAAVVLYVHRGY